MVVEALETTLFSIIYRKFGNRNCCTILLCTRYKKLSLCKTMSQLSVLARLRLSSQQIDHHQFDTPQAVVAYMGAMQAQDYPMSRWAVGCRLPNATDSTVEAAIAAGQIIRTHVLRPTWHLIAAADARWMLALSAPQIRAANRARHRELEITPELISFSFNTFEKALAGGKSLTREALKPLFVRAEVSLDDNRFAHLLMLAELEGLIASGVPENGKHTYALLAERIPTSPLPDRDTSLAMLARTYFRSHGPATLADFGWWSGLPAGDTRRALQMVQPELASLNIDEETYWLSGDLKENSIKNSLYLLPAFDEFIISYKNRKATITTENHAKAVSSNGIFRPMLVADGEVVGLWSRTNKGKKVAVETAPFEPLSAEIAAQLPAAIQQFGAFLQKPLV